jgi:gliding motility-associated-like protein
MNLKRIPNLIILIGLIFSKSLNAQVIFYENFESGPSTQFSARPYYKDFNNYCNANIATHSGFRCAGASTFPDYIITDVSPTGVGYFLMHGTYYPPDNTLGKVWGTINPVAVIPNTTYIFSFYLANVYPSNVASISPLINNIVIGSPVSAIGSGDGSWKKFSFCWYSGTNTTVQLSLENMTNSAVGNDFCLDDIQLQRTTSIPTRNQNITICNGQSVVIGTHTYTLSGIYQDVFATTTGCDSIVNTILNVLPTQTINQTFSLCAGRSIQVGSNTYSVSGNYRDVLRNSSGCDSTVITNLTISPLYRTNNTQIICDGQSLRVGIHIYTTSGVYLDTFRSVNACDSIVNTTLTVIPKANISQTIPLCNGQTIQVGTHIYTTAGTYIDSLRSRTGCDSVITTRITVGVTTLGTSNLSICEGNTIVVGNNTYTNTGTYLDTIRNSKGCDSILTTNLIVKPKQRNTINRTACDGDTIRIRNQIFTTTQNFSNTAIGINGCDSITIFDIKFNPTVNISKSYSFCKGDSIKIGNRYYKDTTTVIENLRTINGCDSTALSKISFSAPLFIVRDTIIASSDSLKIGNKWYLTSGTYLDTLNTNGTSCIKIRTTNLKVLCSQIRIPNAFTPNEDGLNDFFNAIVIKEYPNSSIKKMIIYDRWGNLVVYLQDVPMNSSSSTRDNNRGWNGNSNTGSPLASDVYVYKIDLLDCNGGLQSISGEINLIR